MSEWHRLAAVLAFGPSLLGSPAAPESWLAVQPAFAGAARSASVGQQKGGVEADSVPRGVAPAITARGDSATRLSVRSVAIRSGRFRPAATGEPFATFTSALTLTGEDLAAWSFGVDAGWLVHPKWEVMSALDASSVAARSEARPAARGAEASVRQSTTLTLRPVAVIGLRYFPRPVVRWVADSGWVGQPAARVFVGGGVGAIGYRLRQVGDFRDQGGAGVFPADFESSGVGRIAFLSAGVETPSFRRFGLLVEARYDLASAPLAAGFASFGRADLSGMRASIGVVRRW